MISALSGDAAAGGVPLALAADQVVAREDVVLNPYYQHMGGLYGSEYWTYLLPRRVGPEMTAQLTQSFKPLGTRRAVQIGLLDSTFGDTAASFRAQLRGLAERLARHPDLGHWLEDKRRSRTRDEQIKPLSTYRTEELARSHECFFGADRSYHEARRRFVYKLGVPCAVQSTATSLIPMPRYPITSVGSRAHPASTLAGQVIQRDLDLVVFLPDGEPANIHHGVPSCRCLPPFHRLRS